MGLLTFFMISVAYGGASCSKIAMTNVLACHERGYVPVPAYILPDGIAVAQFCVMKYEAKQSTNSIGTRNIRSKSNQNGAIPISTPDGTPWVSLTWQDARSACNASGGRLITEHQWLSIAHQVVSVRGNWSGGIVGDGYLYSGHNDNNPDVALNAADSDDNRPDAVSTDNQRRALILPNGQVIWDLSGNVWEWVDKTIEKESRYEGGNGRWMSYNREDGLSIAGNLPTEKLPPFGYNANQGMGRYYDGYSKGGGYNNVNEYPDECTGYCAPVSVFIRGGRWGSGNNAGVFALGLNEGRSYANSNIGFRCTH
jgi:formylglycine-generating enzyme required for sulfatase activity